MRYCRYQLLRTVSLCAGSYPSISVGQATLKRAVGSHHAFTICFGACDLLTELRSSCAAHVGDGAVHRGVPALPPGSGSFLPMLTCRDSSVELLLWIALKVVFKWLDNFQSTFHKALRTLRLSPDCRRI